MKEIPKTNHRRRWWLVGFAVVLILLGAAVGLYWLVVGQYEESTDDAYVGGNSVQVMPQISGQLTGILADVTDAVKKGDTVVQLDQADADIALKKAESELALNTRQVSQYFDNVKQLEASVHVQQDNLEKAKEDYDRRQGLVINKTISEEDLRHAKLALDSAQDAVTLAKQQLQSAMSMVGNTDVTHHPQIQQAVVNLRNAYLNWRRTTIYAPETGYVAKRPVQVGQQVTPNTVLMVIVPLNQVWVDANFKESQLRHIRIGQPATMISDVYGGHVKYTGTVLGLSPGTGSAFDLLPPQNATGNWIKVVQRVPVRISINQKELQQDPLQIGLSMTVTVNTHQRSGQKLNAQDAPKIIYETSDYSDDLKKADQIVEDIIRENTGH